MEIHEDILNEEQISTSCEGINVSNRRDYYKEGAITIEVQSIENIDPSKVKEISIKMEFKGQIILEKESIWVPDTGKCHINASGSILMEEPSPQFIDDILANPVIYRTVSVKPEKEVSKEGRNESKKDAKTDSKKNLSRSSLSNKSVPRSSQTSFNILGTCNMDLGPLVKGAKLIKENIILEREKNRLGQHLVAWPSLPRLSVVVSTGDEPLIPANLNVSNNIISVTVESVYNVPRSIDEGTSFDAQILLPNFSEKLNAVIYPNGILTSLIDNEPVKRWVTLSHVEGRGGLTKYKVNPDASDIINSDNEIPDLEKVLRKQGPRIYWNKWRSCVMVKTGSNYFFSRLANSRVWPIEVTVATRAASQKTGKEEKRLKTATVMPFAASERYVAYLKLGSLLYPGVTRLRVASRLYTYSPLDVAEKCGGDFVPQGVTNASPTKARTGDKSKSSGKDTEESAGSPGTVLYNEDGKPVFIVVEVEVWKPYIPKREPEYFFERFSFYFPPKGKPSPKEMNLKLARRNFSKVIEELSYYIKDCYEQFILQIKNADLCDSIEDKFIQHLCREGHFREIKLTLEDKVLDVVGENYGNVGNQKVKIAEVFVDLVNEMRNVTNRFTTSQARQFKNNQIDADDLQLSAEEAIEEGKYDLARRYLLQKLWTNKLNPDYWLDYALYLMVLEDYEKSIESVREALSLDMEHQMGLLMYGLIMTKLNDIYLAELAFQVLLAKYPDFTEGWMAFHAFYSSIGNLEGAEYTLQIASRLEIELKGNQTSSNNKKTSEENLSSITTNESGGDCLPDLTEGTYGIASFSKGRSKTDPLSWTVNLGPKYSMYLKTVVLLLRMRSFELAESLLIRESNPEQNRHSLECLYYTAVSHYLRGQFSEAVSHLKIGVEKYGKNFFLWSLMGHCYYKLHKYDNCIECFEFVIESYNRPNDIHLIYIRMGIYYMKTNKYKCAKKSFLCACKYSPSSESWLGLGAACYNLGEFEEAEVALTEANYLDDLCPVIWGYLTLINIQLERYDVGALCYAETKKKNLQNEWLIAQIKTLMAVHGLTY